MGSIRAHVAGRLADTNHLGAAPYTLLGLHTTGASRDWVAGGAVLSLARRPEGPCLPLLVITLTSTLGHLYRGWAFGDWGVLEH